MASKAAAPATLRAYKADWTHYAAWCANAGLAPVPAEPATVGAYLARAPSTCWTEVAIGGDQDGVPVVTPQRRRR